MAHSAPQTTFDTDRGFKRRDFLLASAAGAAITVLPAFIPTASAKAPLAGSQVISVHRMKLGNVEVTSMLDGYIDIPPTVLQADPALVKSLLNAGGWPDAPMRLPVNTFLVNTGEKLVLLDAGGAKMLGPTAGRLGQCLAAAGVTPEQIDEVYITHMHGDHLHGTVTPDGGRMFPNAILRIAKADMDYWTNPEIEAKAPDNQKGRFIPAKRAVAAYGAAIKPFELGEELTAGISSVSASGHTPGHSCFMVKSGNARLLAVGDTLHVAPVQFPRPEITVAFDWDQTKARATRLAIFEQAVKEGIPIAAVHLPFPGIGVLRKNGAEFVFDPAPWQLF
jgi:glyoxylase-like metal-dependent hydrolase (beta-lactamase superfamily II)